jgi:prepilin-type N-terminal cleavage/methylation domain-containing protein
MVMRRGFTLIELLVAIILFSLIATFLYGGIDQVRLMRLFYDDKGKEFKHHEGVRSLLYRDLAQTDKMTILDNDSDHSIVSLQPERHSLYNITSANVVWLVMRKENTLVRLESAESIQIPLDPTKFYGVHSDIVAKGCTTFRVYESSVGRFASLICGNDKIMVEAPR